jgi:hypothetical protein
MNTLKAIIKEFFDVPSNRMIFTVAFFFGALALSTCGIPHQPKGTTNVQQHPCP